MDVEGYRRDGYCFPVPAIDSKAVVGYRERLESVRAQAEATGDPSVRRAVQGFPNIVLPFVHEIVRSSSVTEPVAAVLGPDLLVLGAAFFYKEPSSDQFVSWHQDLTYWELDDTAEVTAWIALTPATVESGCMRFVPGSHRQAIVAHRDTFDDSNMLSRGQEIAGGGAELDRQAVDVVLEPGEMSLHHGHLFHSSRPNRTAQPRIGLAVRYIAPSMGLRSDVRGYAQLAAGEDRHGNFDLLPAPSGVLADGDLENARRAMALQDKVRLDN